jgi:hypothetical protein
VPACGVPLQGDGAGLGRCGSGRLGVVVVHTVALLIVRRVLPGSTPLRRALPVAVREIGCSHSCSGKQPTRGYSAVIIIIISVTPPRERVTPAHVCFRYHRERSCAQMRSGSVDDHVLEGDLSCVRVAGVGGGG